VVGEGCRYAGGYDGNDVARHVDQQIGSSLGKREQAFKAFYRQPRQILCLLPLSIPIYPYM
jgi:hypothetical protein